MPLLKALKGLIREALEGAGKGGSPRRSERLALWTEGVLVTHLPLHGISLQLQNKEKPKGRKTEL